MDFESPAFETYLAQLSTICSLSRLFSENRTPYLNYRVPEFLFCKIFNAQNLSRKDCSFDAKKETQGIGIKTFILESHSKFEKVAEFNKLSSLLLNLSDYEIVMKIAHFRNERIQTDERLTNSLVSHYHCIGRSKEKITIFESPFNKIDIQNIKNIKRKSTTISFTDEIDNYVFSLSKNTLFKQFQKSKEFKEKEVNIIDNPIVFLNNCFQNNSLLFSSKELIDSRDSVVLPLFSEDKNQGKYVPLKSGLNQWNAAGRKRNPNEVYFPVPRKFQRGNPNFFPRKDFPFKLHLPDGVVLSAKICQENEKALMSNPNKDLGSWILRKILNKMEGVLVNYQDLLTAGFDSVKITKIDSVNFSLDVTFDESFEY